VDILRLFFDCDEFCRVFEPPLRALLLCDGKRHRHRESILSTSEVMTIVILFQSSGFRNLKTYYTQHVCIYLWKIDYEATKSAKDGFESTSCSFR